MSNRLSNESSPYLLQHAKNPVDWYPWCEEAFEKAAREDKPMFLSIGYSTCHWCHVMARESFENVEIAEILNKFFVAVKVDREERPDIDSVYMNVCQTLTGSGGWPLSIFMTADQKPFFAGTYFPAVSRDGMTGFGDLLLVIADEWKENRENLTASAQHILEHLQKINKDSAPLSDFESIDYRLPEKAVEIFLKTFDEKCGGFGQPPKFPVPHNLIFLTLYSRIKHEELPFGMVTKTLQQMRRGGIFDQIGYGFSRYSTDRYYLVPHFEKMLYDNALLILAYSLAYKVSDDSLFLDTARKTADYILHEMTGQNGGFYSAQDADSEGEEGKYYVWDYQEVCRILGKERGDTFCRYFGITKQGNFEGRNIPNLLGGNAVSDDFHIERQILYDYRRSRARLHLDDKILTAWNSLMICAMSMLYRVTGDEQYLRAAENAHKFIEENLSDGAILYVSCRDREGSVKGFLNDYAYYTAALLSLYEVTSRADYLERAEQICREAGRQFYDSNNGGYFLYGAENSSLITRPKETYDGALPGGNSVMAWCLVRLSQLTDGDDYRQMAEKQLAFMSAKAVPYPAGYSVFLIALLLHENPPQKITVVLSEGENAGDLLTHLPLYADIKILPHETEGYRLLDGRTTFYVCKGHTCLPPTNQEPKVFESSYEGCGTSQETDA